MLIKLKRIRKFITTKVLSNNKINEKEDGKLMYAQKNIFPPSFSHFPLALLPLLKTFIVMKEI